MIRIRCERARSSRVLMVLALIVTATFLLSACKTAPQEKTKPAEAANSNSPLASPSAPQIESPTPSPFPTVAMGRPSSSPAAARRTVRTDTDREVNPAATPLPEKKNAALPYPVTLWPATGNGIGSGTGAGTGPARGGGNGINPNYPGRGDPPDFDYNRVFSAKEVDQKARILQKPEPDYTALARQNQITGTVVLKAVFTAGGQVTDIRVVSGLPDGLNENAIAAARRIKFAPAIRNGHSVSMHFQIMYNFNLY